MTELLKNIGISLIIGCIFTYILSTKEFIDYIKDSLIKVVISKDFLHRLNFDERKDMLKNILKPSKELSTIYSGINDFFTLHIDESLLLFKTHFRSGYHVIGNAYFDNAKKKVVIASEISYRMYKVLGNFEKIFVGFEQEDTELFPTILYAPDGTQYSVTPERVNKEQIKTLESESLLRFDQSVESGSVSTIPQELHSHNYLDVCKKFKEIGSDHWNLYSLRTTQPCDKFSVVLTCQDGLTIKNCIPFGNVEHFNIEYNDDRTRVRIFCNEWLKPGLGVTALISR